ncbi:hypothetical protein Acsp04_00450 [Actinomadura sp. NBRC 104425]|nr:hypothetical protein Acsp04_00450 [Actinomadura sp. NBRC 104425]
MPASCGAFGIPLDVRRTALVLSATGEFTHKTAGQKYLDWFESVPVRSNASIQTALPTGSCSGWGPRGAREVVCSPVSSTTFGNAKPTTRTMLRPGALPAYSGVSAGAASGSLPSGKAALVDGGAWSLRLRASADQRDLCRVQRVRNEQGWSVFERLLEGDDLMVPAPAHVGASFIAMKGGVSGPHPWRRPV